jgi:hypothetical protein
VFKKQGKLYAGPSRPHPIPEETTFSDRMQEIVNWMRLHPETKLAELWKAVLPADQADPTADWLSDLFWLLSQGHLLLFADDTLILPQRKKSDAVSPKSENAATTDAASSKTKKPRKRNKKKRRSPNRLLSIEKRVAELPPMLRKKLRGYELTVSHRLRLKAQSRRANQLSSTESMDEFSPIEDFES